MSEVAAPLVQIDGLRVEFGPETVVNGVSLTVAPGQVVALVGESGSGKSVTARTLLGLVGAGARIEAQRLSFDGADLRTFDARQWRELRGRQIGLVTQDALGSLDPLRRVAAEVAEPLRVHRVRSSVPVPERVHALLRSCGIEDAERRARQYPHQLSGGLRQRALIASAIAAEPKLLIADEPTTALDVTVARQVLDLLKARASTGIGILLISHDLAVVADVADHVYVMEGGRIVEDGSPAEVFESPRDEYTKRLLAAIPSSRTRGNRLAGPLSVKLAIDRPAAARTTGPLLTLDGVSKRFRGRKRSQSIDAALDVTFTIEAGQTVGLVGESGSGKSTVGRMAVGLTEPDSGRIEFAGKQLRRRDAGERTKIQMIYQDPLSSFDPRYTAAQVLAEAAARRTAPGVIAIRSASRELDPYVAQILDLVRLSRSTLHRSPRELSGGQRQRLAIARALVVDPQVIVCDEAVSALDVSVQAQVLDLLSDVQKELGVSYLFISHDLGVVQHIADTVLVMRSGRIVESGLADEVFERPRDRYTQQLVSAVPGQAAQLRSANQPRSIGAKRPLKRH